MLSDSQINVTDIAAKRLSYPSAGSAAIEHAPLARLGEKDVLIQTLYSGISRGTESLVYSGKVPESEYERMRCPNQIGALSFPVTYGYSCVGKVIKTGEKVSSVTPDQLVFSLHPHQNCFVVDEQWVTPLPEELPAQRGVLSANAETALNAVWDASLSGAETVAIIGAGVVGLLTGFVASQHLQKTPVIVDINPAKRQIAEALGLEFSTPETLGDAEFDIVFNTSASSKGLQTAIDHVGFEAKIVEMSWYGTTPVTLNLGGAFHSKRLTILSSQVGQVAAPKRATITHGERLKTAMEFLHNERLDALLYPKVDFNSLPKELTDIFAPASDALCPLVDYIDERTI